MKPLYRLGFCVLLLTSGAAGAQPTIEHAGLGCARPGEFVVVLSQIAPSGHIATARVFFRSSLYPDFYYVDMEEEGGQYVGILPQPSDQTPEVIYYVEVLDTGFQGATSPEYHAKVEERCLPDPAAVAYVPGGATAITVGATVAGAVAIPPGFAATGIVGTVAVVGSGGGIGAGTAVAVGAAAAAGAAGTAAAVSSGGSATTTTPAASTTSIAVGSPTTTVSGGATTTSVSGGPTTTTAMATTTTTTVPPSSTTTSSEPKTTTTVGGGALDASCFQIVPLGPCQVRLDASCVAPPVDRYEWTLDLNDRWKKVQFNDGPPVLTYTWKPSDCGKDASLRFKLKVRRGSKSSTFAQNAFIKGDELRAPQNAPLRVRFRARLVLESGTGPGRILVNGVFVGDVASGPPFELEARAKSGRNTLTAFLPRPQSASGWWRFDFSGTPHLVPDSLRVRAGRVLAQGPDALVLEPAGRIELVFELAP